MRLSFAALILVGLTAPAAADPLPARAATVVDYRIDVSLDAASHRLDGRQRLTWTNPSADPVGDLWFHLYLNAFKNSKTTFMKESGGQLRGDRMGEGRWGWIDITSMAIAGGVDLKGAMRVEQPDDGNPNDETVLRVALPQAVPPGGSITLDIGFKAQLPQVFARTGYQRDFHLVGQWFPKLGVYEPAGTRGRVSGGWNCHQFHANSEFYADFGRFLVNITVPSRFIVGATGVRTGRKANAAGTTTYTYEQGDVHDFAWTADPTFVEVKRTFSGTGDVTPAEYAATAKMIGRTPDEVKLTDVEITLLIHPHRTPQIDRHIASAKAGLKFYGLRYGRYPYRTLTVVDPAPEAGGAGGMEYPTFITAGSSFLFNYWPFDQLRGVEMVTVHEFGHQFWYGLVANNEFEEAWLDEGINSYSTGKAMEAAYGTTATMSNLPFLRLNEIDTLRMSNGPDQIFDSSLQPAWSYSPGAYGFYAYQKPEIALRTLENLLGEETMARVMRTYHERWRFRHPGSDDFFAVANEVSGRSLDRFFADTIRGDGVLDYEIGSAASVPSPRPAGLFDRDGRRVTLDPKASAGSGGAKPASYDTTVVVRRRGDVALPVEVAFKFAGKPVERRTWDGRARWTRFAFSRPERLEWVSIDPDRKVILDVDWLDNDRRIEPDRRVSRKWTATWIFMLQNLLALAGF